MWYDRYDEKLIEAMNQVELEIQPKILDIQTNVMANQQKVLEAFKEHHVAESHFAGSSGYGYDDEGRDVLDQVYATVFHTEAALVRPQFVSGTHTIGTALFGLLRPNDKLLYVTGEPYDTLQAVIGMSGDGVGSLKEYGIKADYVDLDSKGKYSKKNVKQKLSADTKMVAIQRSRGYALRDSFTIAEITEMIKHIKSIAPKTIIFVDNCYGEFSEQHEPTEVGADIMAGSLIKNPGGGIARTGGYLAGKKELIEMASYRLTVPGVGGEEGATLDTMRDMFQGFFLAPHVVGEAIKGAIFEAALLAKMGMEVSPKWNQERTDLIQTVNFGSPEPMIKFAQTIQAESPIDSYVNPQPSEMAGYEDKVIMAAGTFVQGASIELSADGPLRPPYTLYLQGGLTYEQVKLTILSACQKTFFDK